MSKLSRVALGAGVFLLLSGGLLALAGRVMGADTSMDWDTRYGTVELRPFGIQVDDHRVEVGGPNGIHVGPDGVTLGGSDGIQVTENGVNIGGWNAGDLSDSYFDPSERPTWSVPREFKGRDQLMTAADLAAFSKLDVDVDIGSVILQYGESYGVELRWYGNNDYRLDYTNENGLLKIWSTHNDKLKKNQKCSGYAVVTLPKNGVLDGLDVEADMGSFYSEGVSARDMDLTCGMGSLTLLGVEAEAVKIAADMGSVELLDSKVTKSLTVSASMGSVTLSGDFACDVDIDADMGGVELYTAQAREAYTYALDADMGSVEMDGETQKKAMAHGGSGSYALKIAASMGGVEVWFGGISPEAAQEVERDNDLPDYLYGFYPDREDENTGFYAAPLSYDFAVEEDTLMEIEVDNHSGSLELGIRRQGGDWVLDQRAFDTESDSVELKPGKYTLVIKAQAFQGSYTLNGYTLD